MKRIYKFSGGCREVSVNPVFQMIIKQMVTRLEIKSAMMPYPFLHFEFWAPKRTLVFIQMCFQTITCPLEYGKTVPRLAPIKNYVSLPMDGRPFCRYSAITAYNSVLFNFLK